jgi:hypothetical protein
MGTTLDAAEFAGSSSEGLRATTAIRNPIPVIPAITVIKAPANNPFQATGYQYSIQLSAAGSIGSKSEVI